MSSFTQYTNEYKKKKKKEAEILASQGIYFEGDDIAPARKSEKTEEKRTWFNKSGVFDDGYQFGDIYKAFAASVEDLGVNVATGILGMGEKVVDAGAYVAGSVGGLFGADEFAEDTKKFIAKDLYDEEEIAKKLLSSGIGNTTAYTKEFLGVDTEKDSVFGEKTDSLAQSGGQLLGTIGLQSVGVPWFVTSGVTSFGSEVEQAFNEGASYGEAGLSGLISAGSEILTEKLFGGSGLGEKGLINLEPLTKGITNKVFKTLLDFGIDMTAEGSEEVFSSVMSRLGSSLYSEKNVDELLLSEEAFDEYLESFIGGMALGGVANTGKVAKSIKSGRDYRTGLTTNEQAVFDKVYNDRIAEAEKNGKKLTEKEKAEIYDSVLEDIEKGAIDVDTIESVLGGETYKTYQDTITNEDAWQKEYNELYKMKNGEKSDEQIDRQAELKKLLEDLKTTDRRNQLKTQLGEEVFNLAKDSKLVESYNEKARRSQTYEADLTQYDTKMQETVKKAVESGILNNTRRTHEFVDMIAKISAEKGVLFDFTNNEKLKASGFAIEGKTVNGYVTKDGVTLNIQSAKSLNSVVGHEVAHVLEGTELYDALKQTITEYAKSKKDYDSRRNALVDLYKNVEGADIDAELTADLVGDYLFTDSNFINHLSTTHRNVFEKIYDEIKYLYKVATAGSKEARELEKVKRAFEKAYREGENTDSNDSKVKYSLDKYTEKQYNDFGWARDAGAISKNELDDLYSKIQAKGSLKKFTQSSNGEAIIEVNDKPYTTLGTDNVFVFVSGTKNYPHINKVIRFQVETDTEMEIIKEKLYERGAFSNTYYSFLKQYGIAREYSKKSALDYIGYKEKVWRESIGAESSRTDGNRRIEQYGSRSFEETRTNEIAPIKKTSSADDVFFDGEKEKYSLSEDNVTPNQYGNYNVYGKDIALETAPVRVDIAEKATTTKGTISKMEQVEDIAPIAETAEDIRETNSKEEQGEQIQDGADDHPIKTVKERLTSKLSSSQAELTKVQQHRKDAKDTYKEKIESLKLEYDQKKNKDTKVANNLLLRIERLQRLMADVDAEYEKRISDIESRISKTDAELKKDHIKADNLERAYAQIDKRFEQDKLALTEEFKQKKETMEALLRDKNAYISNRASELYNELGNLKKGVRASKELGYLLDYGFDWNKIKSKLLTVKRWSSEMVDPESIEESTIRDMLNEEYNGKLYELEDIDNEYQQRVSQLEQQAEKEKDEARRADQSIKRSELHRGLVDGIKTKFTENGLDLDEALKKAKNLSTFSTVDNTPQRVMEKALGYKEGQILADETVNKVAQNETEGIKWLNSFTDRKNGLLAKISKQYNIKPGSKESAAAQMYAEGFYVDDNNNIIQYGDTELAIDFPDARVIENIKGLAKDERIRQIYDDTLKAINESRTRNGYPEIPRLDNYFLHFRAMEDTFSSLGLPFNPSDIRAKDLPTDLNGVTAELKPGQPYFASAMHRQGKRTSFDLLGGLERYLSSAKNQIYHIDDIQTFRALRNYIAETYGQSKGLEALDSLSEEEAQEKIEKVYNSHLSTFAKFLNEEANILAGKTSLIDRGLEGIIGRRGITFLDTVNKQVGANMVGFNVSSSLTNFLAGVQAIAKTNKLACIKSLAQTTSSKIGSIFGKTDSFVENNPTMIRRKGAERFYRTPFQKVGDVGYVLMSAVDNVTTEFIVRAKYNEFIKKGMSEQQAITEADKWTSRLMGDRSLGQMPQLYNSKMLGLVTKFQLEVRNQLDSQFYDTIKETKASNEHIKNGLEKNAKTAAKVTATFFELAVLQHLFGKGFEAVTGYNPAFDIIDVLIKTLGFDDDEESEDTALDNVEEGFLALLEDLPYTSTLTGGRIPISSALPIEELIKGEDEYGNEKSRLETLGEIAPYYILPSGYGQVKKTAQGLSMFDEDLPIAGSYTDSGNLRFPIEDTLGNRVQAGLFGQWANENARDYFDNERQPLKEKQIQEYIDAELPIGEYWEYREGLSGLKTLSEKTEYINSLDLPTWKKNLLINNIADRKEDIDLTDYDNYGSFEEFDFAEKNPEKYEFLKGNGISYEQYVNFDEDTKEAYSWAYENPEKYTLSKAIASDVVTYRKYTSELNDIKADKDEDGKTISGSRKEKVIEYCNNLKADYGEKIILYKSQYKADDTYNYDIIEYLNGRGDISYSEMVTILKELGFKVDSEGNVTWD